MTRDGPGPCPVLVVEDDADVRECLQDILSGEGYPVRTAADGRDALGALRQAPLPCVVLLDLMMPDMNGWDFLETLKRTPALSDVPVVIVSAYQAPSGFPVLHKPVDLDELLRLVEQHCHRA